MMAIIQQIIAWFLAHESILAMVVVAVIDFIWAILPGTKSNGFLQWLYNLVSSIPQGVKKALGYSE